MELISFLIALAALLLALRAWFRVRKMAAERAEEERRYGDLTRRVYLLEQERAGPQAAAEPVFEAPSEIAPPELAPLNFAFTETKHDPQFRDRVRQSLGGGEWEALVGGSLLNKVGALVLVVGIALFLGYSFTRMGPAGRALVSTGVSLGLLLTGVALERQSRYRIFSRGLIGAGWASLYATSYAIWALPEARIISSPLAGSAVMLGVGAGMIAHSLRYRSQAVTAVAYFAAFAALAVSPSSAFATASVLPLAGSLLYLANRFDWFRMAAFGAAATYATCLAHGSSGSSLPAGQILLVVIWALFETFDLLRVRKQRAGAAINLLFALNAAGFLILSFGLWHRLAPDDEWVLAAMASALYLLSAVARALGGTSFEAPVFVAAVLAGLAILGKAPGLWKSAGLALEAELVYLAGLRLNSRFLRGLGIAGFLPGLVQIVIDGVFSAHTRVSAAGISLRGITPALLLHAVLFSLNSALRQPNLVFSYGASALTGAILLIEIPADFQGLALLLLGAVLLEVSGRAAFREYEIPAAFAAAGAALQVLTYHVSPGRALATGAPAVGGLYWLWWRSRDSALNRGYLWAPLLPLLAVLERVLHHPRSFAAWATAGLALAAWAKLGGPGDLRWQAAAVGTCAFAGAAGASVFQRIPSLAEHVGVAGWTAGCLYAIEFLLPCVDGPAGWMRPVISLGGTLLLAQLLYGEVSGGLLTVAWGAEGLALLGAGFPLRERVLRLSGLGLFLVCILKLFVYDLRNLETLYRIFSFIALGIILLAVSFIYTKYRDKLKDFL